MNFDANNYIVERENQLLAKARFLMLTSAVMFAAMPVSGILLYKFIEVVPKIYFVVFLCVMTAALSACMILSVLAMWGFSANGIRSVENSNCTREGLLKSAFIVFFSAVGLFCVCMTAAMILYLIFM